MVGQVSSTMQAWASSPLVAESTVLWLAPYSLITRPRMPHRVRKTFWSSISC